MGINPGIYTDTMCIENSVNQNDNGADLNIGVVFGTDPTDASNFDADSNPTPTLRLGQIDSESNTLMKCNSSPTRLNPSVVTINGNTYGCGTGGDDEGSATCSL